MLFLQVLISTVKPCCIDLCELRHLVRELFPKFKDPVERQGERHTYTRNAQLSFRAPLSGVKKEDTTKLFALIKPELEKIWDKLYLRDMSSTEGKTGFNSPLEAEGMVRVSYVLRFSVGL